MLRHLLKLIWKRKSRNLMLTLEILLAFVLVFAIAAFAARSWQLYRMPLGFQHASVWAVTIQTGKDEAQKDDEALRGQFRRVLEAMPEVEQAAFTTFAPFQNSDMRSTFQVPGGPTMPASFMEASDEAFSVLGMSLEAGDWYSAADDGAAAGAVVLNRRFAEALFPGPDAVRAAIGKTFITSTSTSAEPERYRERGVVEDYRRGGEFGTPANFMFLRYGPGGTVHGLRTILLRLKPDTPRAFEAALQRQLKGVRGNWSYTVAPLNDLRASKHKMDMAPLMVLSVVAAFLLLMVAFGLFGVLWQNTTRRIPEIGLRRAVGANAGDICRQIIAEQFLLSSVAMLAGLALLVQLPLTGALGASLNWPVFFVAAALAMLIIYLLSLLCSLYPGWRASRLSPTDALHYE